MWALLAALLAVSLTGTRGERTLVAEVDRAGVKGTVTFQQTSATDDVTVTSTLTGVAPPFRLEVTTFWTLLDVASPCSDSLLGDSLHTLPEMTSANETITVNSSTVTLYGSLGIAGRSVVVVKDNARLACATLRTPGRNVTYSATFRQAVRGSVLFLETAASEARVVVDLYWDSPNSSLHWQLYNGTDCTAPGAVLQGTEGLPGRLGPVPVAGVRGGGRRAFLDTALSLGGLGHTPLLLLREAGGTVRACAVLHYCARRQAVAEFNVDGVKGQVTFTQDSMLDHTVITVSLSGLSQKASGYHVHEFPVAERVTGTQPLCGGPQVGGHFNPWGVVVANSPAPGLGTGDQYEVGDLSGKHGTLQGKATLDAVFSDSNLPLVGRHSVVGRSLVIHKEDGSRWLCTNIRDTAEVRVGVAYFRGPAIGFLLLTQRPDLPGTTSLYLEVTGAEGHDLTFTSDPAGVDAAAEGAQRCAGTGSVWDPFQAGSGGVCGAGDPLGCPMGNVAGRLGLTLTQGSPVKVFATDPDLLLAGPHGVLHRGALLSSQGVKVACATLREVHERQAAAETSQVTVTLTQRHGLLQTPVTVTVAMAAGQVQAFYVSQRPLSGGTSVCSNATVGGPFNPLLVDVASGYPAPTSATLDKYQVGDLSGKLGVPGAGGRVEGRDWTLAVFGLLSVVGRPLVVARPDQGWSCDVITQSTAVPGSRVINATAVFSGVLSGYVVLTQYAYADGSVTDTTVTVDLRYSDDPDRVTQNHNWHVHVSPVLGDGHAAQGRCASCGGHYDPFRAKARANYSDHCGPLTPLFCEMGDQSSKLGTYSIGTGPQLFSDPDLPLTGPFAAMGRSVVIHAEERGDPRLACADLMPPTTFSSSVRYSHPGLDRLRLAGDIAAVLGTEASDVVVEAQASGDCSNLRVLFTGFDPSSLKQRFDQRLAAGTMPALEQPPTTCVAPVLGPSWLLCLATLLCCLH